MVLDIEMLRSFYASYAFKVEIAKKTINRPLTYAEKVLFTHLYDESELKVFRRGEDYVNFRPNRVAMQDATAQMALLQFMNAGKDEVAVPATVHCDHLIRADLGVEKTSLLPTPQIKRYMISFSRFHENIILVSGLLELVSFIRWCSKTMHSLAV